jgi:peptide/nickel transport system ATP-binding protein
VSAPAPPAAPAPSSRGPVDPAAAPTVATEAPLLTVAGLGIRFPLGGWPRRRTLRAAHAVSFTIRPGEIVALVGESGSGKSTIGRAIARIQPMATGAVTLHGAEPLTVGPAAPAAPMVWRRRVQLIFQDPFASLNPVYSVGHPVARALLLHGRATPADVDQKVVAALESVGLEPAAEMAARYPHQLSGGQRQRVSIARALATEPDLVIADEPTSMLDVSIRMDILRLFTRIRDGGRRSVLLITHDLASARLVADRAVVLYAGQVMEAGPAAQVLGAPRHPYAQLLAAAASRGGGLHTPLPATGGTPPIVDPKPGCPFAARCPHVVARCRAEDPPVVPLGPDHVVRCFLPPSLASS